MPAPSPLFRFLRPLVEFIYPPVCFGCDGPLAQHERRVCGRCWSSMRRVDEGGDLFREMSARLAARGVESLVAAYYFDESGPLQVLLHQLKYAGATRLGIVLGTQLGESLSRRRALLDNQILVPVPLHPVKVRERGYNQSVFIARGIAERTGSPIRPILLRHRYTASQTQLDRDGRRRNVTGAFSIDAAARADVQGRSFLLVDDVITTGATIGECARVLLDAGARSVVTCAVALAPHQDIS